MIEGHAVERFDGGVDVHFAEGVTHDAERGADGLAIGRGQGYHLVVVVARDFVCVPRGGRGVVPARNGDLARQLCGVADGYSPVAGVAAGTGGGIELPHERALGARFLTQFARGGLFGALARLANPPGNASSPIYGWLPRLTSNTRSPEKITQSAVTAG